MEEMDTSFGFLVHDVARQMTAVLDKRLSKHGLTRSHWRAVLYIWRTPGISQTELSEILDLSRMGVTGLLDRMEIKGLVTRKDDPKDRRVKRIYLTEATQELVPGITAIGGAMVDDFFAGISAKDQKALINLLVKVKQNGNGLLAQADPEEIEVSKQAKR
jgi:MarR family transcriptional regulator, transcriptional regulator for hemolysin